MKPLRIGTRDSQLAVWQATLVQDLLKQSGVTSELVYIKSEGDIDTVTPLYALGVTGIFTKTLDAGLLNNRIDIAVHSMKDVPVQLAQGIQQAAVLKRGNHKDIFVPHPALPNPEAILARGVIETVTVSLSSTSKKQKVTQPIATDTGVPMPAIVATSSIRRIAQWKLHYPHHTIDNLRGNVNTRLRKLKESKWQGAIFAAAGLERIGLRPDNAIDLDWMLPAPAQGAIMVVSRTNDDYAFESCQSFNDEETALCTKIERDFLNTLHGGCSTPISALAQIKEGEVHFEGSLVSPEGKAVAGCRSSNFVNLSTDMGVKAAQQLLTTDNVRNFIQSLRNAKG